jgi:hypothetical protein
MDHGARECDHDTASGSPAGRHAAGHTTGRHAAPCHTADHRRDQLVVERRLHDRHDRDRKRRDLQG